MAVNAFLSGRTAAEGYDKVRLPRLHAQEMNPELIDPSYQVKQAQDTFATGNEQISQMSRKDWLRRRIQSATEEGKTTSGIRGATAATNTQLLNRAKEINLQNKMQTGMANIETQLQEENINAANKGAWQTARDYYTSNLGTMAGELGRDLKLEESDKLRGEQMKGIMDQIAKEVGMGRSGSPIDVYSRINELASNRSTVGFDSSKISLPSLNYGDVDTGVVLPARYDTDTQKHRMLQDFFRKQYFRTDRG